MFRKIISIIVIVLSALAIVVHVQSDKLNVTASKVIAAPAAVIFPYVNNLRKFNEWSPWAKMDPNSTITFSGPEAGIGASFTWSGNSQVGEGKETIIRSEQDRAVEYKLEFEKPMKGTNWAVFTFEPVEGGTKVTWSMIGKKNFLMKAMGLVMNCNKMMTDIFDQGLGNLEKVVTGK